MEFKKFLKEHIEDGDPGMDIEVGIGELHELIDLLDEEDYDEVYECIMDVLNSLDPLENCDDPENDDCFGDPIEFTDEFDLEIYETYETFDDFLANEDTFGLTENDLNEIKQRFTNRKKGTRKFKKRKVQLKRDRISRKQELRKKRLEYRVKKRKNMAKKRNYRKTYKKAISQGKHKAKFHR